MHRWKSVLLDHWRAKLVSLTVAALVWFALRHALGQIPAGFTSAEPAPSVAPFARTSSVNARLALAFREAGVEKMAIVF